MPCSWAWGINVVVIVAFGGAFWWAVRYALRDAAASKQRPSAVNSRIYVARRRQLENAQGLRAAQLCAGIMYAAVMSYMYLINAPGTLTSFQVLGLLLSYLNIFVTCWCMTLGLVPYFKDLLLEFNPIVSTISVGSLALYTNFSGFTGLAVHNSFVSKILAYDILWLLEDCPLEAHFPLHVAIVFMHACAHWCSGAPWPILAFMGGYVGLGVALPVVVSGLLLSSSPLTKIPGALHTVLGSVVVGYLLTDQLLRAPVLTEPLQQSAASGRSWLAPALVSLLEEPTAGAKYRYGLSEKTGLGVMWPTLAVLLMSAFVSVINDADSVFHGFTTASMLASISKNSVASALLGMLRGLSTPKKYAVIGMVFISLLQGIGILSIAAGLLMQGTESFVRAAPMVLLCILLGVVMQVAGVLYILLPGAGETPSGQAAEGASLETTAPATVAVSEGAETFSRSTSVGGTPTTLTSTKSMLTRANVQAQNNMMGAASSVPSANGAANLDSYSMLSGLSRGPSERLSHLEPAADDGAMDLRNRVEGLANFKAFMQGLDQQPGVYSLEEFIRGAATAMKGIFPGVAHASFCLLNSTRNCVNMYTFLGDGSRKPPRINVTVAPGTLIYHVLHNCQPVFISNVAAFPGPYADVQFMRFVLNLRSVACLPLVVAGSRVLGVLRLGFEDAWHWTEQEKSIAKQLALVLSSTSPGMGVGGGGLPSMGAGLAPAANGQYVGLEAGYPGAAASILSPNGSTLMGSGSQGPGMPDELSGLAYNPTQPMGSPLPSHTLPQVYSSTGAPGSGPNASGPIRRMRQPSRSSMHYGPGYPADPSFMGGPNSGGNTGDTPSVATTLLAGGNSSRSSVDYNAYYASTAAAAGPGGYRPSVAGAGRTNVGHAGGAAGGGGTYGAGQCYPSKYSSGTHGLPQSNSGSGQQLNTGELDETWMQQQSGSARVRRALGGPAQAQGHGVGADIKMLEVIGRGGFGSVYKAFWRGMKVAVKVLEHEDELVPCTDGSGSKTKLDTSSRRAALLEGVLTSTISHPHVVQTYDYRIVHLDPQTSLNGLSRSRVSHETHIIMEFCDRGSLQDAIEQGVFVVDGPRGARGANTEPEVDMELIIMTLAEVSSALEYLHRHRITHRDLKPKNILLQSSEKDRRGYVGKVSDFGLSQVLPDTNKTQISTKYSGTVTHMAPELIEDGKVYQQGDVYAFGIIMWEIYTSMTPYQNMAHPQIMVGVVTHNLRPKFPSTCPDWYKNLAYRCWRKDPKTRPPFTEITKALLTMLPDKGWNPGE